jgi:hypothetical protein
MRLRPVLLLLILTLWLAPARAEHASIDLRLYCLDPVLGTIKAQTSARVDEDPPAGGVNPRPILKVKAGEPLILEFVFINTYPHNKIDDVAVTYFVVREERARQKVVPDLNRGTVTRGKFQLNFKPRSRVGAKVAFKIPTPGIYLLRVQSENTKSDHEHFAAIDVQVE